MWFIWERVSAYQHHLVINMIRALNGVGAKIVELEHICLTQPGSQEAASIVRKKLWHPGPPIISLTPAIKPAISDHEGARVVGFRNYPARGWNDGHQPKHFLAEITSRPW